MAGSDFDSAVYAKLSASLEPRELARRFERSTPWYRVFLARWLPADRDAPIIDVPCGAGNLLWALSRLGYRRVTGYDLDNGKVSLAGSLGLSASRRDAFEALEQTEPGSISIVFSLDFLEHLPRERALSFCRLSYRALRPGGLLICRTPSADGPFAAHDRYADLTHQWAMTAGVACLLMEMAGFTDCEVHPEAPVPYKWQNVVRRLLFWVSTRIASAWLRLIGVGAPAIWTRSMWVIARRAATPPSASG